MLYTLYNHKIQIPQKLCYLGFSYLKNDNPADIEVILTSANGINKKLLDNQFELKPNYGFYYRENIGLFEFLNGGVIKIHLESKADTTFFQTLFNFPFACIFAQNGLLPIHASAVRFRQKTILFPGITKKGKSTLAAALMKLGGKLITEDIALFKLTKNKAKILPSYPLIKLSDEANIELSFSKDKPFKIHKTDRKRSLYKIAQEDFYNKESEIDFIIFPEWSDEEELKLISHKECLMRIISNNFFTSEIPTLEKNSLKNNAAIIKNSKCFQYKRKRELKKLKNFQKEVLEILF